MGNVEVIEGKRERGVYPAECSSGCAVLAGSGNGGVKCLRRILYPLAFEAHVARKRVDSPRKQSFQKFRVLLQSLDSNAARARPFFHASLLRILQIQSNFALPLTYFNNLLVIEDGETAIFRRATSVKSEIGAVLYTFKVSTRGNSQRRTGRSIVHCTTDGPSHPLISQSRPTRKPSGDPLSVYLQKYKKRIAIPEQPECQSAVLATVVLAPESSPSPSAHSPQPCRKATAPKESYLDPCEWRHGPRENLTDSTFSAAAAFVERRCGSPGICPVCKSRSMFQQCVVDRDAAIRRTLQNWVGSTIQESSVSGRAATLKQQVDYFEWCESGVKPHSPAGGVGVGAVRKEPADQRFVVDD